MPSNKATTNASALLLAFAAALFAGRALAQQTSAPAPAPAARGVLDDSDDQSARLPSLRSARDTLMGISDFNAALNPALAAVEEHEKTPDPDYPKDLLALARIQTEVGELENAEGNYLKAIELLEAAEGEFSITLVDPYRALGRSYIKAARYPEAITTLEEAQHISQRNLGLFNVEQAGLIDDITTAYLGIGDTVEARRMQQERLDNAMKRFGADDPRVIPFRYQLADYYQRSRLPGSARQQYEAALKSQETNHGSSDPELLSPLRQLVRMDILLAQGEEAEAHSRLVAILGENANIDPAERGLSLALLGDWEIVTGNLASANAYYKQAWESLGSKPDANVAEFFATPAMLDFIAPLSPVDRGTQSKPYSWAEMVFSFDVSADGRPFNVEIVGRQPPLTPLESRYTRRLRETHFRPRLVAGEPVATDDVRFKHYFRFYVAEEDKDKD